MKNDEFNFNAIARVNRRRKKGLFGMVLEVPKQIAEYIGSSFWVIYGNSCFYCNSTDEIYRVCRDHDWDVRFFEKMENTK